MITNFKEAIQEKVDINRIRQETLYNLKLKLKDRFRNIENKIK